MRRRLPNTEAAARPTAEPRPIGSTRRGIEISYIYSFGDKYSASMGRKIPGPDGKMVNPQIDSYGIGVSRLDDDAGTIWPDAVAPWVAGLVKMRGDDSASVAAADDVYAKLIAAGIEMLFDDRGWVELGSMDLIGLPWEMILGPRGLAAGRIVLNDRRTGEKPEPLVDFALGRPTA